MYIDVSYYVQNTFFDKVQIKGNSHEEQKHSVGYKTRFKRMKLYVTLYFQAPSFIYRNNVQSCLWSQW